MMLDNTNILLEGYKPLLYLSNKLLLLTYINKEIKK